ncbi:MAG: UDP-N-acetylmuramoyl-tripeptide--D-alanyl-D-alanine ligase [Candidatus Omnitrophica bacterium]|nr:UDP-N-acetylmuramoyl-tripeptide--D-alanyl-D-alanine ligase [Candidatus Omnitrophota bacterium]
MNMPDFSGIEKIIKPAKIYNLYHFRIPAGFSIDSRTLSKGEGFIAVRGKYSDGHDFIHEAAKRGASLIIAERDIPNKPRIPYFLVDDSIAAMAAVARHIRRIKNPKVYAITGSVGKTTTKEMLAFILESRYKVLRNYKTENNIFGVAKACLSLKDENMMVTELGTNTPGEIKTLAEIVYPDIGIITFIKPAHLEGLGSLKGVFAEKVSMFSVRRGMEAILNYDDKYLRKARFCGRTYWYGKTAKNGLCARLLSQSLKESKFLIQGKYALTLRTSFPGFIYSALAALLGAGRARIPLTEALARLDGFDNFPSQRMETKEVKGFTVLNDAYNANPFSFQQALRSTRQFAVPKIAVIGDMLELGKGSPVYHQALAQHVIENGFEYCLAIGQYTPYLIERLKKLKFRNAYHFSSLKALASCINEKAERGWLIFLKGSRRMELEKVLLLLDDKDKS